MPSNESTPFNSVHGRDLAAEAQVYVRKMVSSVASLDALCPLDSPEKTEQAIPFWSQFYDVIGFSTLDIELENAILQHPDVLKLMPDLRRVMGECEVALEVTWAAKVAVARDPTEARQIFNGGTLHGAPESVAILGSGALPETGVWMIDWARKNNQRIRIHSLEIIPERLEQSKRVYEALGLLEDLTFEVGDVRTAPKDLSSFDVVYFNATLGTSTREKEDLMLDVARRMRPGALVLTRSTYSLKTMAYPASANYPYAWRTREECEWNGHYFKGFKKANMVRIQTSLTPPEFQEYLLNVPSCHFHHLIDNDTLSEDGEPLLIQADGLEIFLRKSPQQDGHLESILQAAWALFLRTYVARNDVSFIYLGSAPIGRCPEQVHISVCHVHIDKELSLAHVMDTMSRVCVLDHKADGNTQTSFSASLSGLCNTSVCVSEAPLQLMQKRTLKLQCGLNLVAQPTEKGLQLWLHFDPSLVSTAQAKHIVAALEHLLENIAIQGVTARVSDLGLRGPSHYQQIVDWNGYLPPITQTLVHERFCEHARAHPERPAIVFRDETLTYGEVDEMSSRLGASLQRLGVAFGVLVPLCFEKSAYAIVAMLGVLKAGGAFIPLDPDHPNDRLAGIVDQAAAEVVLTSALCSPAMFPSKTVVTVSRASLAQMAPASSLCLQPGPSPTTTAYVYFTSGTTGQPKGAVINHGAFNLTVAALSERLRVSPASRVLQFAAYTFDASLIEIFPALYSGGCVCVPAQEDRTPAIVDFITSTGATVAFFTPSFLRLLRAKDVPTLRTLVVGGEALTRHAVDEWADQVHVIQVYGPTECCMVSTMHDLPSSRAHPATIGLPFNCACWIVRPGAAEELLPIGAIGELLIQGPTVFREYLANPALTCACIAERPPWLPVRAAAESRRLYKTGDLVCYNSDGTLSYVGRKNTQVKVRGQRVELAGIEHLLLADPSVVHAVVVLPQRGPWKRRLVTVLSFDQHATGVESKALCLVADQASARRESGRIRDALARQLPPYMISEGWLVVEQIPTTASGKAGRRLIESWLESLDDDTYRQMVGPEGEQDENDRPLSSMGCVIQMVWAVTLNITPRQIGSGRSFINLGGDSISAMQFMSACRERNVHISVPDIHELALLARDMSSSHGSEAPEEVMDTPFGLSQIQETHFRFTQNDANANSFSQGFLLKLRQDFSSENLRSALVAVIQRHSMLRARFQKQADGQWTQRLTDEVEGSYRWVVHELDALSHLAPLAAHANGCLDIQQGPMVSASFCRTRDSGSFLNIIVHHLVVDLVSFRIIVQDLEHFLQHGALGKPRPFPFQAWCPIETSLIKRTCASQDRGGQALPSPDWAFWGLTPEVNTYGLAQSETLVLSRSTTEKLLKDCHQAFTSTPIDVLLATLVHSFADTFPERDLPTIFNESHGRQTGDLSMDLSNTVGWFTSFRPVPAATAPLKDVADTVRRLKDQRVFDESMVGRPILAAYHAPDGSLNGEVLFNYMGKYQQFERSNSIFAMEARSGQDLGSLATRRLTLFEVSVSIRDDQAEIDLAYHSRIKSPGRVQRWGLAWRSQLEELVEDLSHRVPGHTLSDFPFQHIYKSGADQVVKILESMSFRSPSDVETICPVTPIQSSILESHARSSRYYHTQILIRIGNRHSLVDARRLHEAWRQTITRHTILRTVFLALDSANLKYVQVVLKQFEPIVRFLDHAFVGTGGSALRAQCSSFPVNQPPHHLSLWEENESVNALFEISHALIDFYSLPTLLRDWAKAYDGILNAPSPTPYTQLATYVVQQPTTHAVEYLEHFMENLVHRPLPCISRDQASSASPHTLRRTLGGTGGLSRLTHRTGVTMSTAFRLAWALVLQLHGEQEDIGFGYVTSGRDLPIPDMGELVGPCLNLLPCRLLLSPTKTIESVMRQLHVDFAQTIKYQHAASTSTSANQNLNTLLNYRRHIGPSTYGSPSTTFELIGEVDPFDFDLVVELDDIEDGVYTTFSYWREDATDAVAGLADDFAIVLDLLQRCELTSTILDIHRAREGMLSKS
ncbi:hypothetical protein G7Y89_g9253 [Cudoniella acicularis]|uniref:Carrier domain-containing protein n=1 Tax=Cudoniella acicularis TaxID=354080 RepID=A0A8H4RFY8_9HELO|nr:hypothetical protein G7Y89_g9253 [Cudoniella acicularis]